MSVDLDFDSNNDEPEDIYEEEFEGEEFEDTEAEEEEPKKSSPLRIVLLVLLVLVLLCAVCYLVSRFAPIPGLGGGLQPAPPPAQDTLAPPPQEAEEGAVDGAVAPDAGADEGAAPADDMNANEDEMVEGEADAGEGVVDGEADRAPADDMNANETDEDEMVEGEMDTGEEAIEGEAETGEGAMEDESTDESGIIITTPVPGPTATPGPTDATTAASCDDTNVPPSADAGGPYDVMMGKGQAVVNFDGTGSTDTDGQIVSYEWDFDDDSATGSGAKVQYVYTMTGTYTVELSVTDNCGAIALDTADVTIVEATTPVTSTPTVTPTVAPPPNGDQGNNGFVIPPIDPALGTAGFCYLVQRGDTLWGIAQNFGVDVPDLAYVNGVSPNYYVIAGQGLFVPTGPINPYGPNIYPAHPGDTLSSIAARCNLSTAELGYANALSPDSVLVPGQLIVVPPPWSY